MNKGSKPSKRAPKKADRIAAQPDSEPPHWMLFTYRMFTATLDFLQIPVVLGVVAYLGLPYLRDMVDDLAGTNTSVSLALNITAWYGAGVTLIAAGLFVRLRIVKRANRDSDETIAELSVKMGLKSEDGGS